MVKKLTTRLTPTTILYAIIGVFILYFVSMAFARYDNIHAGRFDLGNMDQTVWNVLHGNGFTLTDPLGLTQQSRAAIHADFLLALMAPLYLLWSSPKMLLLTQTILVALGALPIYWYGKELLKSKKIALVFSAAYLLFPPLHKAILFDFHAVVLSTPLLLFACWYMYKKQYGWFVLFALLAALGKEHVWITVGLMGLYIALVQKKRILGLSISVLSFSIFYYIIWHLIPSVAINNQHFALVFLSDFGGTQDTVLKTILTNPIKVITTTLQYDRIFYLFKVFSPVGFLSLFSPLTLLFAAADFGINLLSNNGQMRQAVYQYDSITTVFIFISAIQGYKTINRILKTKYNNSVFIQKRLIIALVLCISIASYVWGELPIGKQTSFGYILWAPDYADNVMKVRKIIPSTATVSATNNLGAYVSQRKYLWTFPINALQADYILVKLNDQYAFPSNAEQSVVVEQLLRSTTYTLLDNENDFFVFKKKSI